MGERRTGLGVAAAGCVALAALAAWWMTTSGVPGRAPVASGPPPASASAPVPASPRPSGPARLEPLPVDPDDPATMCAALQDAAEWEFDDPAAPETVASLVALWAAMRPFADAERARDLDTLTGHAQTAGTVATDQLTPDAAAASARIDEWVVSACPPAGLASPRPSVAPPELGPAPKWGQPLPDVSAWRAVGRLDAGGLRITVWDAGESVSPRDSEWIDPDTRRPLVQAGDTLNWWVWTATNVSGQPLNLTSQLARVQARWSNTGPGRAHQTDDRAGLERLGARFDQWLNPNKGPYTLAPGETICGGGNMRSWLPTDSIDSPMMRVQATVIPAGSDGQPDLARKVERATRMNW